MNEPLESASKRLLADPALTHRVVATIRQAAGVAGWHHPIGAAAIDAELANGMAAIGRLPIGAEQLLAAERLAGHFDMRCAESTAEKERQVAKVAAQRMQALLESARASARAGWAERVSSPTRASIRTLKDRLDRVHERLACIGSEAELRESLGILADAISAAKTSVELEAKSSIGRQRAASESIAA